MLDKINPDFERWVDGQIGLSTLLYISGGKNDKSSNPYNLSNTYDYSMIPKLGRLHKHIFTPYKKDSDQLENFSDISTFKLVYADTYEECIMLYNDLIQEKITWHQNQIKKYELDLLEENFSYNLTN